MFPQAWPETKKLHPVAILFFHNITVGGGENTTVNVFKKEKNSS